MREHAQLREAVYDELFGECESISHEIIPLIPHIDVYIYKPGYAGREFYTLVSSGMSDESMLLPDEVDSALARREIILYCEKPLPEYIKLVRFFARYPSKYETWLGHGHTMPNGSPATPLFENSVLVGCVLSYTIVSPDNQVSEKLIIEGYPVEFLWVIPLTEAEIAHKLKYGFESLLDVFDEVNHPIILDPHRKSYL